jgi:hypothetical protein
MNVRLFSVLLLCAGIFISGCDTYPRAGLPPARAAEIGKYFGLPSYNLTPEQEDKILALNPEHVTGKEVAEVLSNAPAPQIINIHGGIAPVHIEMVYLSEFLVGMGYPEKSIRNPNDGTWTFSCYESMKMVAGMGAWYYEKEGMRPMFIGHSQGGMQVVRILDYYAESPSHKLDVWNPLTWKDEGRSEIVDPLGHTNRPVAGFVVPFVAAMGAGGLTRILPNQWDMNGRLRDIPNSVEEFTGFYKGNDLLGGDLLGYGSLNYFRATGTAKVRNVRLPTFDQHGNTPNTVHLLKSQEIRDWINNYTPVPTPNKDLNVHFDSDSEHLLFAAEIWYSVKKHWVIELQNLIRARRATRSVLVQHGAPNADVH